MKHITLASIDRCSPNWPENVTNNPTSVRVIIFTLITTNSKFIFLFFFKEALSSVLSYGLGSRSFLWSRLSPGSSLRFGGGNGVSKSLKLNPYSQSWLRKDKKQTTPKPEHLPAEHLFFYQIGFSTQMYSPRNLHKTPIPRILPSQQ